MKLSTWWTIGGVVMLVGGIFALFNLFAATISAVLLAGWFFLVAGALQLIAAFSDRGLAARIFHILWGILAIYLAITLFANPLAGMLTLTIAVALIMAVSAVIRLFLAVHFRRTSAFWGLILSAVISGALAALILFSLPESAAIFLGIYLGLELLFGGFAFLAMGAAARSNERMAEE
ncbi:uncharacterized membrane protein HdeD (DUF308 family) [Altererythrobacter atlanticus]|uniref:Acid-resistance membrane protein n=1 Tax=Croceibacterium atlanticum TaxID=1267766 RepID=A0A0F7KWB6_9SPHN|nr:DUF308 domain-containing protein [Croceibacterium atlanticum]AKH44009.1 acid-resistance membrane protein [Croceibacterium atlanticum]MBB5732315.1 uncharacterized membrane protein HdeD (DUF308 family) [Croceibacterium atlanticum]